LFLFFENVTENLQVNKLASAEYIKRFTDRAKLSQPFKVTGTLGKFDAWFNVYGGGTTGQVSDYTLGFQ
jgi:ribosomal protein S9